MKPKPPEIQSRPAGGAVRLSVVSAVNEAALHYEL